MFISLGVCSLTAMALFKDSLVSTSCYLSLRGLLFFLFFFFFCWIYSLQQDSWVAPAIVFNQVHGINVFVKFVEGFLVRYVLCYLCTKFRIFPPGDRTMDLEGKKEKKDRCRWLALWLLLRIYMYVSQLILRRAGGCG